MNHQTLYDLAHAAGLAAAERTVPTPMLVVERANPLDDSSPITRAYPPIMDGPCGFAWVVVKPGNCSFARWLVANHKAKKHDYGGVRIWVSQFGQSMQRKEAYANAFTHALRLNGINAQAYSRLD